ncbi:Acetyltransferase [Rhodospirillaceae bacterium LM-1]|nr:Acetyltransferase [Rhodospirillaceae bacterium LM-1]
MAVVSIRAYKPGDEAGIVAVILPIQQDEFAIQITVEQQPDLSSIPDFYQQGMGNFWVAEADGKIVGTIALKDIGNRMAALRKMFVAAAYRGHGGVARQLLERLLSDARKAGVAEVYLGTTAAFLAAHRFYEKNGFMEISKQDLPASFPLMAVDSKFYRLNLLNGRELPAV